RIDGVRSRTGRTVGAHSFACGDSSDSAAALIRSARVPASFSDRSRSSLDASLGRERNLANVSYAPSNRTLSLSAVCLATSSPPHLHTRRVLLLRPVPRVAHGGRCDERRCPLSGPGGWGDAGLDREAVAGAPDRAGGVGPGDPASDRVTATLRPNSCNVPVNTCSRGGAMY